MNEITSAAGSLFGEMNIVEAKSDSVIAMLPTMTDEQVNDVQKGRVSIIQLGCGLRFQPLYVLYPKTQRLPI